MLLLKSDDETGFCPFLKLDVKGGGKFKCSIHAAKPGACANHPIGVIMSFEKNTNKIDYEYVKVGTEYQTYSIVTGTAGHQWTAGTLGIAIGNVSKLYIKNYKIEEVSEQQNFGFQSLCRNYMSCK